MNSNHYSWRRLMLSIFVLVVSLALGVMTEIAEAYITYDPYYYGGDISQGTYAIDIRDTNYTFARTRVNDAVTDWNSIDPIAGSPVDVNFTSVSSTTAADYVFIVDAYPYDWCGKAQFYDDNWNEVYSSNTMGVMGNWTKNRLLMNTAQAYFFQSSTTNCGVTWQGLAAHEMGHALGLSHSQLTPAVMESIQGPNYVQTDDVDGIRSIYNP